MQDLQGGRQEVLVGSAVVGEEDKKAGEALENATADARSFSKVLGEKKDDETQTGKEVIQEDEHVHNKTKKHIPRRMLSFDDSENEMVFKKPKKY